MFAYHLELKAYFSIEVSFCSRIKKIDVKDWTLIVIGTP